MVLSERALTSSIAAILICLSLTVPAFANTSSKPVSGYGTLTGTLSGSNYNTRVTQNPDSAQLTIKGSMQDRNGKTVVNTLDIKSTRGSTYFSGSWSSVPSNVYVIYGTHGVQGGSKYGAAQYIPIHIVN